MKLKIYAAPQIDGESEPKFWMVDYDPFIDPHMAANFSYTPTLIDENWDFVKGAVAFPNLEFSATWETSSFRLYRKGEKFVIIFLNRNGPAGITKLYYPSPKLYPIIKQVNSTSLQRVLSEVYDSEYDSEKVKAKFEEMMNRYIGLGAEHFKRTFIPSYIKFGRAGQHVKTLKEEQVKKKFENYGLNVFRIEGVESKDGWANVH